MTFDKSKNVASCKFCDPPQLIHPNADEFGKWHPTNMDDSKHTHVKPAEGIPKSTQGLVMRDAYPKSAPPDTDEEDDEGHADKMRAAATAKQQPDWKEPHDENIATWKAQTEATKELKKSNELVAASNEKLTTSNDNVAAAINRLADVIEISNLRGRTQ